MRKCICAKASITHYVRTHSDRATRVIRALRRVIRRKRGRGNGTNNTYLPPPPSPARHAGDMWRECLPLGLRACARASNMSLMPARRKMAPGEKRLAKSAKRRAARASRSVAGTAARRAKAAPSSPTSTKSISPLYSA